MRTPRQSLFYLSSGSRSVGRSRVSGIIETWKAKVLCHNIVCLIHEMYELGIESTFWKGENWAMPSEQDIWELLRRAEIAREHSRELVVELSIAIDKLHEAIKLARMNRGEIFCAENPPAQL